ncbi:glycosyltransferase [Ramlibacter sp.]|uniref:glycosyltransferase n=1 Tax=Ramlibacter sp. TaxID=1917967 RepID=UPI002CE8CA6D|nr:glycosyltransferase [Ramlibacter sp.]HWI84514.1 glycosyltransferase [Ramlibacter sp.]
MNMPPTNQPEIDWQAPDAALPAGPWLVFARHPGEEVSALGGSLIRARLSGIAVAIVYTHSAQAPFGDLLPEIRRVFLAGERDPTRDIASLAPLVREIAPTTVFLPSRFEHDTGLRALAVELEGMLADAGFHGAAWYYELSRVGEVNRILDISAVFEAKQAALARLEGQFPARQPPRRRSELTDRLRALALAGATAAEAFWAEPRFEPMRGATAALAELAHRSCGAPAAARSSISVVVRTRNRPQLLEEALASLALQDYPELDVIVVNDGGSPVAEIANRFPGLAPRVIDLQPGRGRSSAANVGIAQARGDWLLILDDDDVYLAGGVRALAAAATDPDTVYFGSVDSYSYDGGQRRHLRTFGAPYDADLMLFENQIPFIGCLMPTAHVRAIGGLDESFACFEDWDLYLRLAERCRFQHVARTVAEYRVFGQSFITGKGSESLQEEGLERIFAKHLQCAKARPLARAQLAVKRELIPREVRREAKAAEIALREKLTREVALEIGQLRDNLREEERKLHERTSAEVAAVHERTSAEVAALHERTANEVAAVRAEAAKRVELNLVSADELFVSIVIVNYNGRHHLEKCLPSVFETRKVNFEVIVIDNGSSDDSVAWMREQWPQVRVIAESRNLGFGLANLVGARNAKSNYLALLNSDTVVTPDWLEQLLRPLLLDPAIGATCSQLRLLARPEYLNARGGGMSRLGFGYDIDFGYPFVAPAGPDDARPVDVLFPSGAAMLMRRTDFLDVGAFDPSYFMYHEDVDLGWRLWLLGKRVVLCPASIVFHAFGGTTKSQQGTKFRDWMGNRHNLRSLWKNYELRNALWATRRLVWLWLRTGQAGLAWHALSWNLIHIRGTVRERRRLQRQRRISDNELFARGLIPEHVPPAPSIPPLTGASDSPPLIVASQLWPGRTSAVGRLGPGWYGPEGVDGDVVRATCGDASATLKVEPGATGTVVVEIHVPDRVAEEGVLTLECNGGRQRFGLAAGSFWRTIEMPGQADENGLLRIRIGNTPWRPHDLFGNGDLRRLGCIVRQIAFRTEDAATAYAPSRVSVIVTTFNRRPVLLRTLDALAAQTWKDFEVIVVDDGSRDDTWSELQKWRDAHPGALGLKIFTQQNTGQGIARNNGLEHADGELVLFIGDDIIPDPDFVEQHVRRHRELGVPCAVVGYTDWERSAMQVTPLLEHVNEAGHQFGYRYMKDGDDVPYTCFYTSNVSLPRAILGPRPFDPEFRTYGWEDVEVGYRLSKRGVRIVYNRQARARHLHPMDLRDFYRRQVKVGGAIGKIYAMHPELASDQPLMPPARPPRWLAAARRIVPPLLPVANWLDRRSVRLPHRLYDLILGTGFWVGRTS